MRRKVLNLARYAEYLKNQSVSFMKCKCIIEYKTVISAKSEISTDPVEAQLIRLQIKSFSDVPGIYEMMMFN